MDVSIVICTWNRSQLLARILAAFYRLEIPEGLTWELLVVNNGSTDDTDAVIERHQRALPIRRLFEPRQGLSRARNLAVKKARGELILWTDDDAIPDTLWVSSYAAAAKKWPGASFFGGKVVPLYERAPSKWILNNLGLLMGPLALRDLGPDERPLAENESVYGVNFALRRKACEGLEFDPALGRSGNESLLGEEIRFLGELRNRGGQGIWVPTAGVAHWAPPQRFTRRYLWRYFEGVGRTEWKLGINRNAASEGKAWLLYWRLCSLALRLAWQTLLGRPHWLKSLSDAAQTRGIIKERFGNRKISARATGSPG